MPRLLGAFALRRATFADVAADAGAGPQAGMIVVFSGLLEATVDRALHPEPTMAAALLFLWVLAAMIGWLLWSGILWLVGTRMFDHAAAFGAVLRAVSLAHAPSLLYGLAAIPGLTEWEGLIRASTLLWFLCAIFAATRGIFDLPVRRAAAIFAVVLVGRLLVEVAPQGLRMVPGSP